MPPLFGRKSDRDFRLLDDQFAPEPPGLTSAKLRRLFAMPMALEQVTQEAMELSAREKMALAEWLLESADAKGDSDAEVAWENEIAARIRAIDEGHVVGVAYED